MASIKKYNIFARTPREHICSEIVKQRIWLISSPGFTLGYPLNAKHPCLGEGGGLNHLHTSLPLSQSIKFFDKRHFGKQNLSFLISKYQKTKSQIKATVQMTNKINCQNVFTCKETLTISLKQIFFIYSENC